ncbi:hypothetical protein [Micromonospora sp. WMMD714]|uniref:hypothetical protein n=1 Tax=Micromonospora sp. WMMD714 TaxID=3016097 RepID=UPI00249CD5EC|nr:hypothetical protein [Micromonospora sp. WMMD714]WFE62661.1 hypothetical protein O7625_04860 [Micromonospora sp. WMMD714]
MGMPDAEGHGPSDGLPGLPPEWGRVVVPDDASALADEAAQLRRELRRRASAARRRRLGPTGHPDGRPPLGLPLLILLVAVLATAAGLVTVTWPRSSRGTDRPTVLPQSTTPVPLVGRSLPALDLVDADQTPVPLRGLLPAMIILVDSCACAAQLAAAAGAAPGGVQVVSVAGGREVTPAPPVGGRVRALADPTGELRAAVHLPARPGAAPALLVDRAGTVVRVLPELGGTADYRDDLARLAG